MKTNELPGVPTRRTQHRFAGKRLGACLEGALLACVLVVVAGMCRPVLAGEAPQYFPGKFVWFDLVTDDPDALRRFYGAVFGWQFRTVGPPPASYTLIENAGDTIGGLFYHARPPKASSSARWLSLISVPDPAQTVRYVQQHGGTVITPPTAVAGRGTHALFRDPEGSVFGVLKAQSGDRSDTPVENGDFFWVDLLTADPARATEFYSGLVGYEVSYRDVTDTVKRVLLASEGFARAGIVPLPPQVEKPGWLPYVLVDDVAATLQKVTMAGGRVLLQPRADLLEGNLAVIGDPRGGVIGVVNWQNDGDDNQGTTNGAAEQGAGGAK